MRGAVAFTIWLCLFVAYVATEGALSIFLLLLMIAASAYGGHLFAEWSRRRHR